MNAHIIIGFLDNFLIMLYEKGKIIIFAKGKIPIFKPLTHSDIPLFSNIIGYIGIISELQIGKKN